MDLIWFSEKIIEFGADLIWLSEKKNKFGDFCHFAPIATNFLRAKIYPSKVICKGFTKICNLSIS